MVFGAKKTVFGMECSDAPQSYFSGSIPPESFRQWPWPGLVEPKLGIERPTILYDYPASQAALARVREGDPPVAKRFELYVRGIELANGYHELLDPAVLQAELWTDGELAPDGFDRHNPSTWGKVSRNAPCPCGSGKKFKYCHGTAEAATA